MKKRLFTILTLALIIALSTSTVYAAGFKLSAGFKLGSLDAFGYVSGLGKTDVTLVLDASGIPLITCINNGGNSVPGQSSPKITASGSSFLPGNDPLRKNGKAPFTTKVGGEEFLAWDVAGCPSSSWVGHIDFVFWTNATISVYATNPDGSLGALLLQQNYTCVTTHNPDSITCTPVP